MFSPQFKLPRKIRETSKKVHNFLIYVNCAPTFARFSNVVSVLPRVYSFVTCVSTFLSSHKASYPSDDV